MNENKPTENSETQKRTSNDNPFAGAPVVFSYTRAQALEDGVLVDLTEWAKETGFTIPVACTSAVWNGYVVPPEQTRKLGQSERGRGHDLLWMLFVAIKRQSAHGRANGNGRVHTNDQLLYEVLFLQAPNKHETVKLKAICGAGDNGEPVMTIMMPDED